MKRKIFIIEEDKAYLDRLTAYLVKNYGDESEIASDTKADAANMQMMCEADVLLVQEEQFHLLEGSLRRKTVLLSEKAITELYGTQTCIRKFQKPELIYHELVQFVSKQTPVEMYTEVKKQPSIEIGMLLHNEIAGLVPVEQQNDKGLQYQTQGLLTWSEFIQQEPSQKQLLEIVSKMLETMRGLEEYMLEPAQVVFEEDRVYIHPQTFEPFLCYVPKELEPQVFWGGLKGLGKLLVRDDIYGTIQKQADKEQNNTSEVISGFAQTTFFESEEEKESYGDTEVFWESQEKARQSKERREDAKRKGISPKDLQFPKAYLIRENTGEKIWIDTNIFKLGKEKDYVNYCILDNPTISRSHADIVKQGEQFFIVDQNSLNHTFVNGVEIIPKQMVELPTGTEIRLADERFQFTIVYK